MNSDEVQKKYQELCLNYGHSARIIADLEAHIDEQKIVLKSMLLEIVELSKKAVKLKKEEMDAAIKDDSNVTPIKAIDAEVVQ